MNVQRRAKLMSRIVLMLLQQQNLTGAKITKASRGARHLSLGLKLFDSTELDKALKLAEAVALASNSENVIATRQEGLIIYQFQLAQGYWETYTRDDLPTSQAVGFAEQRQPIEFNFEPPHALIAGSTGSGKSETLKSILVSLISTYSTSELIIILIDPHRELDDFANESHLALPIASSSDDIRNVLVYANRELAHRKAENIKDGKTLVIAIDEAASDEVLSNPANLAVIQNISKQARKYRIHLIVGTQKPTHGELPSILDNLLNKWVGQLSDAGLSARITGHAGLMAHKLTPKGDFLHITGPDVSRLQIAMATDKDFAKLERTEIQPVNFAEQDVIILPDEVENSGGRPPLTVEPAMAAKYFWHNPNAISIAMAKEMFGLSRTAHNLHKDFVIQFTDELRKLRREHKR